MESKKNILEELEKEAPFLSKVKKENHFSIPENYFEVLPEIISGKKLINKSLILYFDKLSYRILIPISAVVIPFFIVLNFNTNTITTGLTSDQISELIIEDDYIEFDEYLIYEAYAEVIEEEENETISDQQEYINYLIENDIDINSIIEEL